MRTAIDAMARKRLDQSAQTTLRTIVVDGWVRLKHGQLGGWGDARLLQVRLHSASERGSKCNREMIDVTL